MESHSASGDDEMCVTERKILRTKGLETQKNQEWMRLNSVRMGTENRNKMNQVRSSCCSKMMQETFCGTSKTGLKKYSVEYKKKSKQFDKSYFETTFTMNIPINMCSFALTFIALRCANCVQIIINIDIFLRVIIY